MPHLTLDTANSSYVVTYKSRYAIFFPSEREAINYITDCCYEIDEASTTRQERIDNQPYMAWKLRYQPKRITLKSATSALVVSNLYEVKPDGGELVMIRETAEKPESNQGYFNGHSIVFHLNYE